MIADNGDVVYLKQHDKDYSFILREKTTADIDMLIQKFKANGYTYQGIFSSIDMGTEIGHILLTAL